MRTVTFGDGQTSWNSEDLGLLTLGIEVQPPEPKFVYVEIAGRDGVLDMSEAVAGRVTYSLAELKFSFRVVDDNCKAIVNGVIDDLNGQKKTITVSDDEDHEYNGRCTVAIKQDKGYYIDFTVEAQASVTNLGA